MSRGLAIEACQVDVFSGVKDLLSIFINDQMRSLSVIHHAHIVQINAKFLVLLQEKHQVCILSIRLSNVSRG